MELITAMATHAGLAGKENQDELAVIKGRSGQVLVVAGGMGGAAGGKIASRTAIEVAERVFGDEEGSPARLLQKTIAQANEKIHQMSFSSEKGLSGMGTTLAALAAVHGRALLAHVGDSRIYRFRKGRLECLTKDHSQVQELLDKDLITPQEAGCHPDSYPRTRALGPRPNVEAELSPHPLTIKEDDLFLLCTDGLWGVADEVDIARVIAGSGKMQKIAADLIDLALAGGGYDNISLILGGGPRWAKLTVRTTRPAAIEKPESGAPDLDSSHSGGQDAASAGQEDLEALEETRQAPAPQCPARQSEKVRARPLVVLLLALLLGLLVGAALWLGVPTKLVKESPVLGKTSQYLSQTLAALGTARIQPGHRPWSFRACTTRIQVGEAG